MTINMDEFAEAMADPGGEGVILIILQILRVMRQGSGTTFKKLNISFNTKKKKYVIDEYEVEHKKEDINNE